MNFRDLFWPSVSENEKRIGTLQEIEKMSTPRLKEFLKKNRDDWHACGELTIYTTVKEELKRRQRAISARHQKINP
jgi:hypothetical protein